MTMPTQQILSPHFSHLVGRNVVFEKVVGRVPIGTSEIFAAYRSFPSESTIVVKADLAVLGGLAGALVGLPDAELQKRLAATELDDLLKDAIYEIFNVASPVIATEDRAVLQQMVRKSAELEEAAQHLLTSSQQTLSFKVKIDNVQKGHMHIYQ